LLLSVKINLSYFYEDLIHADPYGSAISLLATPLIPRATAESYQRWGISAQEEEFQQPYQNPWALQTLPTFPPLPSPRTLAPFSTTSTMIGTMPTKSPTALH
jgi:hypothetical protein